MSFRAWIGRVWLHVTTLLEKPNVPGTVAITVLALALGPPVCARDFGEMSPTRFVCVAKYEGPMCPRRPGAARSPNNPLSSDLRPSTRVVGS
jgi:hypothetical protein